MKFPCLVLLALATVFAPSVRLRAALPGDHPLLVWNDEVLNATRLARNPPPIASLHFATFHAALYDVCAGFQRTHRPWRVDEAAPEGASLEAALASAAHTVLVALWGQSSNPRNFDLARDRALQAVPDDAGRAAGIAYGRRVAEAILAERARSGWNRPVTLRRESAPAPGVWRETPPGFRPPVTPQMATTVPFVMTSPSQFRAPPPPPVDSAEHAAELAFVARVGVRDNAERTEYETLSTPFWADDLGTATPAGHWNVIAQDLVRRNGLDVHASARLFALLNFAAADAAISCWDTKFHYNTWRPETALRELSPDLNPHHRAVPDFIPNMGSPAHPDYTSGHSTYSAAASRLLERWFGTDEIEFTTTSDGLPGAVRSFKKLSEARHEIGMSRVWGGIHTMSANLAGQEAGIKIADFVFEQALQPVPSIVADR
jgi:hypothetical protein